MQYKEAFAKLQTKNQQHLLAEWEKLSLEQQNALLVQIEALDLRQWEKFQALIKEAAHSLSASFESFEEYTSVKECQSQNNGWRLISEGKVGCLLVAGGEGTRLGTAGPKGMVPVTLIQKKTLFQLFAEKCAAAGKRVGRPLSLAYMVSPSHRSQVEDYFQENKCFGLSQEQVSFFEQGTLPLLDTNGNFFLENPSQIASGPNGNGYALRYFVQSGLYSHWKQQGIQYVNFVQIDNPLADPFDADLVGFHQDQAADVTVKCVSKRSAEEKVGVVVRESGKMRVVEYSEFEESERRARLPDGQLKHRLANISLFCFHMDFIREAATHELPLHAAFKANRWKFEAFIFDLLPYAKNPAFLLYPRSCCFAPLKNRTGEDSLESVQQALQEEDMRLFHRLTGIAPPPYPFELSQEFHYPTSQLEKEWQGRHFPLGRTYVTSEEKGAEGSQ